MTVIRDVVVVCVVDASPAATGSDDGRVAGAYSSREGHRSEQASFILQEKREKFRNFRSVFIRRKREKER